MLASVKAAGFDDFNGEVLMVEELADFLATEQKVIIANIYRIFRTRRHS